jgi:hypothetical protein
MNIYFLDSLCVAFIPEFLVQSVLGRIAEASPFHAISALYAIILGSRLISIKLLYFLKLTSKSMAVKEKMLDKGLSRL